MENYTRDSDAGMDSLFARGSFQGFSLLLAVLNGCKSRFPFKKSTKIRIVPDTYGFANFGHGFVVVAKETLCFVDAQIGYILVYAAVKADVKKFVKHVFGNMHFLYLFEIRIATHSSHDDVAHNAVFVHNRKGIIYQSGMTYMPLRTPLLLAAKQQFLI